jgi:NAD-dependent deacetylase
MSTTLTEARHLLRKARDVLVITGAGISAESGVPTFRGEGERWRNRHFTELASPRAFAADPKLIWEWYLYRRSVVASCEPNAAHRALAEWQKERSGRSVVTQNVDGLHELAGSEVVRMHGSLWRNTCLACFEEREDSSLVFETRDGLPRSPCHGEVERPAIVWFGEMLPEEASLMAQTYAAMADVIITIGTSGLVGTANQLIGLAHHLRAMQPTPSRVPLTVIDVNLEDSAVEATLRLRGPAGQILPELLSE